MSRTAHELITDAISGVYGDDPERSRVAADAIIEALGLVTLYHVKTPTIEHRGGLKYEGSRWWEYLRLSDIERDWADEPRREVFWSLTSARHPTT